MDRYVCLGQGKGVKEAMRLFYYELRKLEMDDSISCIVITDIRDCGPFSNEDAIYIESLFDKMFRSCSGRLVPCE